MGWWRSATVRGEQGWPTKQSHAGTRELVSSEQLPEAEAEQLTREAAIYCQAIEAAQPLRDAAERDFKHTVELLDRAETVLAGLDGPLKLPLFREILAAERKSREEERTYTIEEATKFAKQLDQPSPEWQTTDLDGNPYALKDYRGQVVLIDFWYRGCGWCIRAMPQVKQLSEDFKGQPVAILGMNSDRKEADARFVIDAFRLEYPTLKNQGEKHAEGIAAEYSIDGFPTLVLIDRQGVIRDVHVGYSPTLPPGSGRPDSRAVGSRQNRVGQRAGAAVTSSEMLVSGVAKSDKKMSGRDAATWLIGGPRTDTRSSRASPFGEKRRRNMLFSR